MVWVPQSQSVEGIHVEKCVLHLASFKSETSKKKVLYTRPLCARTDLLHSLLTHSIHEVESSLEI
jgi:hypothetical protein